MQVVKVTNHSPMDVKYQWSFIDSAIQFENKDEDEGLFTSIGRLKLGPCCVELHYGTVLGALTLDPVSCSSLWEPIGSLSNDKGHGYENVT